MSILFFFFVLYCAQLHIVTYNTKFANIGAAVASGESNALAVVGILFDVRQKLF